MNKRRKLLVTFSLVICIVALALLLGGDRMLPDHLGTSKESFEYEADVTDFSKAVARLRRESNAYELSVFTNDDGEKYLFLPSMCDAFSFANLSKECTIVSSGQRFRPSDYLLSDGNLSLALEIEGEHVDDLKVLKSSNIGAMYIDCEVSQERLDETNGARYGATCKLYNANGKTVVSEKIDYIRTRGNTSFGFFKKSYEIKFTKERELINGVDASDWVLLANDYDTSLLKNQIVNKFVEKYIDNIAYPVGDYVDVYINGDYRGNYLLCTKPHKRGQAVDITDLDKLNKQVNSLYNTEEFVYESDETGTAYGITNINSYRDITGGYLVELIPEEQVTPDDAWFMTDGGFIFKLRSPRYASLEEVEYIRDYFNELEIATLSEDGINPNTGKSITDYIDVDSWMARYFLDLLFADSDSGVASSFFYKNADSKDSRIFAGPIWDYDQSFYDGTLWDINNIDVLGANYLCDNIMNDSAVSGSFRRIYDSLRVKAEFDFPSVIYNLDQEIEKSREMNAVRWGKTETDSYAFLDNATKYLSERLDTIDERVLHEDPYVYVDFYDIEGLFFYSKEVKRGEKIGEVPDCTSWTSVFCGWEDAETGKMLTKDTRVYKDTRFNSRWMGVDLIVQNGLNISDIDVDSIDVDTLEKVVAEIRARQEKENEE